MIENPFRSDLFREPVMAPVWRIPGVLRGTAHMCAHGMTSRRGLPLHKRMVFVTNSREIFTEIILPCPGPGVHPQHDRVEGADTKPSQVYPEHFAHRLLEVLQR
ncbi:MAG: hypothetical protein NXI07_15415, partial [bacterium]|nr:hypothetical protein [bacterium]